MAKDCYICGNKTIFYVWSTSRNFPKETLIREGNINTKKDMSEIAVEGVPVCFKCNNELKVKVK